jgi:hypothetical protein
MIKIAGYILVAASLFGQPAAPPQTTAQRMKLQLDDLNRKVLEMAEDFPAEKYNYKPKPEMRTFGEMIIHIASGNVYGAKFGRGEKVKWDEMDPKQYPTKAAVVAEMKKTMSDMTATFDANPEGPRKNFEPWISILEHSGEHYGLLVGYYRLNGLVPPESRPKK